MEAFLGTVLPWPGTFAPQNWAFCDGRLLQINAYQALYAVIGTQYGGNGTTTFAVPDLRGRTILGSGGQAPLTNHTSGQFGGAETVTAAGSGAGSLTLTQANLPAHTHNATLALNALNAVTEIRVSTGAGGQLAATEGATLSSTSPGAAGAAIYQLSSVAPVAPVTLGGVKTTVTGGGAVTVDNTGNGTAVPVNVTVNTPVATMPPFLALNYIICLNGYFPTRN
jgi:microcystin-dependent protein